eukprot:gene3812-4340_t
MATNYKSTVIRNLPDLVKLDNCEINEEERRKSFLEGDDFQNPQNLPDFKKLDLSATLHESDVLRLYTTGNDIENQPSPYIISEEGNSSTSAENFSSSSNKNILSAVLLLMNELEHDDLKTLQIETQKKLNNYERKQDKELASKNVEDVVAMDIFLYALALSNKMPTMKFVNILANKPIVPIEPITISLPGNFMINVSFKIISQTVSVAKNIP